MTSLTTTAAATLLGCSRRTVLNLINRGHLAALRLGPTGDYRIQEADLQAFVTAHGHHCPATVAASAPGTLPDFIPEPVTLATRRTPDGLLIVQPHQGN